MIKNLVCSIAIILLITVFCKRDRNIQQSLDSGKNFYDKALTFQNNYQYDSAIFYYQKEIKEKLIDSTYIKTLIGLSSVYWRTYLPDSAKYYYQKSSEYYKVIKNSPRLLSTFLLLKGKYLQKEGKYIQSKLVRDSAFVAKLSIVTADDTSLARFYNDLGTSLYLLNKPDSAIIFYSKALRLAQKKTNPDNMDVLTYLFNLEVMFNVKNNRDEAKKYIEKCESLINRTLNLDYYLIIDIYYDFYGFYLSENNYEKAFQYQNLSLAILQRHPDKYPDNLYEFYIKKSEDYANLGQFENASLCCEKASDLVNLYKKRFDFDLSNLLFQKGSLIVQQDQNISEAIPHFKQCICLTNKSRNLKFHLSSIYLAKCYLNLKQYENSIDVLNNELQILESTIPDNLDMPEYLINWFKEETILNLAKAHELKNDFNETEILIEDGLKLATNKLKYSDNFLHKFLNNKGSLLIETGNYKKALEIYEKVIQDCSQEFLLAAPSSKLQAYSNDDLLKATEGKAWSLYMLAKLSNEKKDIIENLKNCLSTYEFLIELTDKHRKLSLSENDNLFLGETYDSIFDNTIKTANLLYHATHENEYLLKAFAYADSKKAHVISCNMNDTRDKRAGKIPDSLLAKEKNLKEAISFIQSREREGRFSEKEQASGTDKLLVLTNELEKLISKFENEYPEYYWLKYKTRTVDIPALFKQVGNEKTLVEFSLTSDSLFTFIVSAGKIHLVNRPSIGIEDSVLHFRKKLSYMNDHALTRQGIDEYVHEASWLYKILIKPAEPYILGKEITIVPDGPLSLLPFDALVSSDSLPKQPDYGLLPYLLYKYTIGYAYSAELYSMQQQMNPAAVDGVLAFAPEYKNFLYNRPGNLSNKPATIMLSPLRGSQEEAENITGTFGGKAITGKKATETMFKRHAAENKVLHLAMHTIVDNEFPMYSKLVFSTTKDTTDDGFLNTFEVYNLDLKTPLVVLSACNTGYGKLMKGEGIISLARGFIYAGCPSMVITLWSIADRSSSDLMQLFYKNLDKKQNIDRSLQNAKIEYIQSSDQRMSHPYYWAGFIQTGKTSPVIKTKTPKWYAWPVGLGIVIICFGLLFYYRKY